MRLRILPDLDDLHALEDLVGSGARLLAHRDLLGPGRGALLAHARLGGAGSEGRRHVRGEDAGDAGASAILGDGAILGGAHTQEIHLPWPFNALPVDPVRFSRRDQQREQKWQQSPLRHIAVRTWT